MFLSSPIFKDNVLAKGRNFYPKVTVFSEILPLSLKNKVNTKKARAAGIFFVLFCLFIVVLGSSCTQELQSLFGCLKKWEFDDKPCSQQHVEYMTCVQESNRLAEEFKEAAKKVLILF